MKKRDLRHEGDEAERTYVVGELEPGREDELEKKVQEDERRRQQRRLPGVEPDELVGCLEDEEKEGCVRIVSFSQRIIEAALDWTGER